MAVACLHCFEFSHLSPSPCRPLPPLHFPPPPAAAGLFSILLSSSKFVKHTGHSHSFENKPKNLHVKSAQNNQLSWSPCLLLLLMMVMGCTDFTQQKKHTHKILVPYTV